MLKSSLQNDIKTPSGFKFIPKIDQSDLFSTVWDALHSGMNIGIFPEGGSHDRTDLLPLKAGFTLMALGGGFIYAQISFSSYGQISRPRSHNHSLWSQLFQVLFK